MTPEERVRAFEPARAVCAPRGCKIVGAGYGGPCWVRDGAISYGPMPGKQGGCIGCGQREHVTGNERRHAAAMRQIIKKLPDLRVAVSRSMTE